MNNIQQKIQSSVTGIPNLKKYDSASPLNKESIDYCFKKLYELIIFLWLIYKVDLTEIGITLINIQIG